MSTKETLIKAKELIEDEENWRKGSFFDGGCMCAIGAVIKATHPDATSQFDLVKMNDDQRQTFESVKETLVDNLPEAFGRVETFNDNGSTSHRDIMKLFDRAIQSIKE